MDLELITFTESVFAIVGSHLGAFHFGIPHSGIYLPGTFNIKGADFESETTLNSRTVVLRIRRVTAELVEDRSQQKSVSVFIAQFRVWLSEPQL